MTTRKIDGTYATTTVPTVAGWRKCDEHEGHRAIDLKGTTYCYALDAATLDRMREARSVGHALGIAKASGAVATKHGE